MRPYDRAKQIFADALTLAPEARADFVAHACEGDAALAREVQSLLAFHEEPAALPALPERLGDYRVTGRIGEGGMGVVLRGEAPNGRAVALKLLRRELLAADLVARFAREAKALAQLDHPGIARLLASGMQLSADGPTHWLALEFVEGRSLAAWAAGGTTQAQRIALAVRLAEAITHAHGHGIVHRDLKPENVLVRPNGEPVLLDFGIARFMEASVHTVDLTRTGLLMGTVRYMSPEQAEGRDGEVGPASDQYSLAVLTYELLAGRLPYDLAHKSIHSALATLMTAEPQPLTELEGPHRKWLERVLGKALQKRPSDRYTSVEEFAADLRRVASGQAPLARPPRRPLLQRREVRVVAGAAVLAVLVAALSWFADTQSARTDPARQWPLLDDEIARTDQLIHGNTQTRQGLNEALRLLDSARQRLAVLPRQPWTDEVQRFVNFRTGEAQLFLGRYTMDPALLRTAGASFERATHPPRNRYQKLALPDSTAIWTQSLEDLTSITANASRAHALMDLAGFEGPADPLRTAAGVRWTALVETYFVVVARMPYEAMVANDSLASPYAFRLNEYSESLIALAACNDSLASLDLAIRQIREGIRVSREFLPLAPLASMQHNLGTAFVTRARLTHSPSDLDSAEVRLRAALDWRVRKATNLSRNVTVRELAELALLRAALTPDAKRRIQVLEQGRALVERWLPEVPADAHELHRTQLRFALAELELALARHTGNRAHLGRADSLLASPGVTLSPRREPVIFAAHERLLAMADALAAARFGEAGRGTGVRLHAERALEAVPATENPRQARELTALIAE